MRRASLTVLLVVMSLLAAGAPALAQATTGSISGRIVSSDGQPLPGVMVTATSPMLQGTRTAVTSESGDYLIPLLPPGVYSVSFTLEQFQTITRTQQVAAGYNAVVNVTLSLSALSEAVQVIADAQPLANTAQVATNVKQQLRATLPSN